MSSLTASPLLNVRNIKKLILEETERSPAQETVELNLLRQLQVVEEMREKVYGLANNNKRIRSMLTSKNIMLDDYISDVHACSTQSNQSHTNPLARREATSRESKDPSSSITEVKRKRKKGAVRSIIETIEGEKGDDVQAKVLKQVLQHRSIRQIVQRMGFIDSKSNEYGSMSDMVANAKHFLVELC